MNREFLPEAVLGVTVGLLLAVLAVYRTTKPPSKGVMARGGVVGILLYAIIAAQVLIKDGMTAFGLLLLLVTMCLPVAGMVLAGRRPRLEGPVAEAGRIIVSVGLAAAMLIAGAQTLSLLGLVDPRAVVIVLAVVAGLLVAADAARASGRISSLTVWLLIVPILLVLALGILLGNFGQAVSPIITTPGVPVWTVVALMVAVLVLGAADAALTASRKAGDWSPIPVLAGAFLIVILLAFGMLMFFGGAVVAPSVQFFVVPANINALPGLAGLLLAILALLFAAVVAYAFSGVRSTTGQDAGRLFLAGIIAAAVLALIDPGIDWVVLATSLVAAAVAGATSERGLQVGLALSAVSIVVLTVTGSMNWNGWPVLGIVIVTAAARLASRAASPPADQRDTAEVQAR